MKEFFSGVALAGSALGLWLWMVWREMRDN